MPRIQLGKKQDLGTTFSARRSTIQNKPTVESVADDPDKQYLAVPLVMFGIDMQQLLGRLARTRVTISTPYRILDDRWGGY